MRVGESILWLQSHRTGKRFPTVLFSGDTDMATEGLTSLTSLRQSEVVISDLTGEEMLLPEPACSKAIEQRLNTALGRSDLRSVWIKRVNETVAQIQGENFQDFRSRYEPPKVFYRDIFDEEGEAIVTERQSIASFRATGGVVTRVPGA